MPTCLIGLGSNLGDRRATLEKAVARLCNGANLDLLAQSRWHETKPVGGPADQGPFLNGAIRLETTRSPEDLLKTLQEIETALGRRRTEHWGPRTVDLDLLLYDRLVLETPALCLPHPRMAWRRFVLEPAAEVAASMIHPTTGWPIARLLEHLNSAKPYLAVGGPVGAGKTDLARRVAEALSAHLIAEPDDKTWLEWPTANRSGNTRPVELEFLEARVRLLHRDLPGWSAPDRLYVSDFWLEQSVAAADVLLTGRRREALRRRWEEARSEIVCPKLIVVLDPPSDRLDRGLRRGGDIAENRLGDGSLDRIRRAVLDMANAPGRGPVLRLTADDRQRVLGEVLAAVEAMSA
jgi:2-amino-4-hydroxy-6-hydroxymethyldihydropteridine diphosphokinase